MTEIRFSWAYVARVVTWGLTMAYAYRLGGWVASTAILGALMITVITTFAQVRQLQDVRSKKTDAPLCSEGLHVWPHLEPGTACARCGEKIPKEATR